MLPVPIGGRDSARLKLRVRKFLGAMNSHLTPQNPLHIAVGKGNCCKNALANFPRHLRPGTSRVGGRRAPGLHLWLRKLQTCEVSTCPLHKIRCEAQVEEGRILRMYLQILNAILSLVGQDLARGCQTTKGRLITLVLFTVTVLPTWLHSGSRPWSPIST